MLLKILKLTLAFFIFISIPLILILLTPIYLLRFLIEKATSLFEPKYGKLLTTKSCCVGVDEIYENPQWTLLISLVVRGGLSFETLKQLFEQRVLESRNEAGELNKPELRQYVSTHLGFLFWKWDQDFKIENHVHQTLEEVKYEVLNEETLLTISKNLIYKPYAAHRSPWELIFLENYQHDSEQGNGPECVILLRAHHVLADGFSLLKLFLLDLFQNEKLEIAEAKYIPGERKPGYTKLSRTQRFIGPLRLLFRGPYDLASAVVDTVRFNSNEWHVPEEKLTRVLNVASTSSISLETVKEVKRLCKSSFASVLLAAYAGALRFMSEAGFKVPEIILCATALPMPNHPEFKLRNHATGVLVLLPTGSHSATQRLKAVDENQLESKTSTLPIVIFLSMICVGGLFGWMTKLATKNNVTTAVGSIFPGPNVAEYFSNYSVQSTTYAGGLTRGNVGLGFSCLSYNGKLVINVGIDEGLVPESKLPATKLIEYMTQELNELKREAESKSFETQNL